MQDIDILNLVRDTVIVFAFSGEIRFWNASAERVYGLTAEQAIGRNLHELLAGHHPFGNDFLIATVAASGQWKGELCRKTASGRCVTAEVVWTQRASGEIVEVGRDLGQLSQLEQETRLAAHRYRNIFQAMAASFWELDFSAVRGMIGVLLAAGVTDLRSYFRDHPEWIDAAMKKTLVVDVNEATLNLFRVPSRDRIVGGNIAFAWPEASRGLYADALMAAVERRDSLVSETVLTSMDGQSIEALFTVCWPTEHKGRGNVLVGVIDLTARKQAEIDMRKSEGRYRALFHAMPVGLAQLDMRGLIETCERITASGVTDLAKHVATDPDFVDQLLATINPIEVNAECMKLFGAETREQMLRPITWAWKARPDTIRRSILARLRGDQSFSEETKVNTLDGRVVDALYTINFAPEVMERGTNIVAFVDISDRIAAQAALEQLQTAFAHASRVSTLGELTATIAHEINQPLTAIAIGGETALRWLSRPGPDLSEVRDLARRVVADARRAADIISRIRDMARNRAPVHVPLSVAGLVDEAVAFMDPELRHRNVGLRLDVDPELPKVLCDRVQVQQVIANLVINAAQAMTEAATPNPTILITSALVDHHVTITVSDNGPGLPEGRADQLFQGFVSTKSGGLGIGLSICRTIVEAHGGTIIGRSRPKGGASFTFTLRTQDAAPHDDDAIELPAGGMAGQIHVQPSR